MGIFIDTLDEAMDEAARFIARAKVAQRALREAGENKDAYPAITTAAVRRSSMDLTRSLAKLRSR